MDNQEFQQQNQTELEVPMTLGEWLITILVLSIPCLNLIMAFVWGFGNGGNINRRNFCRAALIFMAISAVLGIIFSASIMALFANALNSVY